MSPDGQNKMFCTRTRSQFSIFYFIVSFYLMHFDVTRKVQVRSETCLTREIWPRWRLQTTTDDIKEKISYFSCSSLNLLLSCFCYFLSPLTFLLLLHLLLSLSNLFSFSLPLLSSSLSPWLLPSSLSHSGGFHVNKKLFLDPVFFFSSFSPASPSST